MPRASYLVVFKPQALDDIFQIASYIAEKSQDLDVALLWVESVHEHVEHLVKFPHGYSIFEIPPYRKINHGRYLVVYRIDEEAEKVVICRVVHGTRLSENLGPIET